MSDTPAASSTPAFRELAVNGITAGTSGESNFPETQYMQQIKLTSEIIGSDGVAVPRKAGDLLCKIPLDYEHGNAKLKEMKKYWMFCRYKKIAWTAVQAGAAASSGGAVMIAYQCDPEATIPTDPAQLLELAAALQESAQLTARSTEEWSVKPGIVEGFNWSYCQQGPEGRRFSQCGYLMVIVRTVPLPGNDSTFSLTMRTEIDYKMRTILFPPSQTSRSETAPKVLFDQETRITNDGKWLVLTIGGDIPSGIYYPTLGTQWAVIVTITTKVGTNTRTSKVAVNIPTQCSIVEGEGTYGSLYIPYNFAANYYGSDITDVKAEKLTLTDDDRLPGTIVFQLPGVQLFDGAPLSRLPIVQLPTTRTPTSSIAWITERFLSMGLDLSIHGA